MCSHFKWNQTRILMLRWNGKVGITNSRKMIESLSVWEIYTNVNLSVGNCMVLKVRWNFDEQITVAEIIYKLIVGLRRMNLLTSFICRQNLIENSSRSRGLLLAMNGIALTIFGEQNNGKKENHSKRWYQ